MVTRALLQVFSRPLYVAVAGVLFLSISALTLVWSNLSLIRYAAASEAVSITALIELVWTLVIAAPTSMGYLSAGLTVAAILLVSLILSILLYMWRSRTVPNPVGRSLSGAGVGTVAAFFGVGCAACGSMLLTALLSLFGASAILAYLPLHGLEFTLLALLLLLYTLYTLAKLIGQPKVCI